MKKLAKFQEYALTRKEMRDVSGGGLKCDAVPINWGKGPATSPDGKCYDMYSCRHTFLGIPYGQKIAVFKHIPGCKMQVPKSGF